MPTVAITRAVVVRSQPGLAQGASSPGVWQFPLYLPWATLLRLKCSTCLRNPCFHAAMWALLQTRPKDIPCASILNGQVEPCDLTAIIMPCKYMSHEKCMRWLPASTCLTKNASSESVDLAEEHDRAMHVAAMATSATCHPLLRRTRGSQLWSLPKAIFDLQVL